MKYYLPIIALFAFFNTATAQQWKQCVREQKFIYAEAGDGNQKNTGISFCSNDNYFSIFDKEEKKVFKIANYEQSVNEDGNIEESFTNAATDTNKEGEYDITIVHSKPASITIHRISEAGGVWYVTTQNIAPVRKPENSATEEK